MKPDQLREFLQTRGVSFDEEDVQYGRKFTCEDGEIFVAYDSGKILCQGKTTTDLSRTVKDWKKPTKRAQAEVRG